MAWWLANAMANGTAFAAGQGHHWWHHDGSSRGGRTHKAWLLVSKNRSTAPSSAALASKSNIIAVSAAARYGLNCQLSPLEELQRHQLEEHVAPHGCRVSMQPGDLLFFREDVWHRTQDVRVDRLAFSVPVFRLTPRSAPDVDLPRSIHRGEQSFRMMYHDVIDAEPKVR